MKKWLKLPKVKIPKVKLPNIPLPSLKLPNLGILNYLWDVVKESIAQIFTILGFFIAWFTLTGTAADIVGIAIIVSIGIWLLTIRLRD
jgi:hypothetical protein